MTQERVSFSFGENWQRYLAHLGRERYAEAKRSLCDLIGSDSLEGKTFLDIGCGSGIFSLAAVELGAREVFSLDVDPKSVKACRHLKETCNVPHWEIGEGSILDEGTARPLGAFDVVYAWGVLHHTGAMWRAMDHAARRVRPGGLLVMAIYNRTGTSGLWLRFKRLYNSSGPLVKALLVGAILVPRVAVRLLRLKHPLRERRGMSVYYDARDWAGGLPYEYASFQEVCSHMTPKGFILKKSRPTTSIGCNEFVFEKAAGT